MGKVKAPKRQVMLACSEPVEFDDPRLRWPMLGSVKFDGTRCLVVGGDLLTRTMKPQPNQRLAKHLEELVEVSRGRRVVFDCELYDHEAASFGDQRSVLGSRDAPIPESMTAHVFDCLSEDEWDRIGEDVEHKTFDARVRTYENLFRTHPALRDSAAAPVEQILLGGPEEAEELMDVAIAEGFEGLILRDPSAPYKWGRSTAKEGWVWKFKLWDTLDAEVIGVVQRRVLKGDVQREQDVNGYAKRTYKKEDYTTTEAVGAFRVRDESGEEFEAGFGKGFSMADREDLWRKRDSLIGEWVEVRHLPHGASDSPRMPQVVRFREAKK